MSNRDRIRCSMEAAYRKKTIIVLVVIAVIIVLLGVGVCVKAQSVLAQALPFGILLAVVLILLLAYWLSYRSLFANCDRYELLTVVLDTPCACRQMGFRYTTRRSSYYFTVAIRDHDEGILLVDTLPMWLDDPLGLSFSYDLSDYLGKRVDILYDRGRNRVIVLDLAGR